MNFRQFQVHSNNAPDLGVGHCHQTFMWCNKNELKSKLIVICCVRERRNKLLLTQQRTAQHQLQLIVSASCRTIWIFCVSATDLVAKREAILLCIYSAAAMSIATPKRHRRSAGPACLSLCSWVQWFCWLHFVFDQFIPTSHAHAVPNAQCMYVPKSLHFNVNFSVTYKVPCCTAAAITNSSRRFLHIPTYTNALVSIYANFFV